jgi:hypothetical protein
MGRKRCRWPIGQTIHPLTHPLRKRWNGRQLPRTTGGQGEPWDAVQEVAMVRPEATGGRCDGSDRDANGSNKRGGAGSERGH